MMLARDVFNTEFLLLNVLQQTMRRNVGRLAGLQEVTVTWSWRQNDLDAASDTVALCWHYARSMEHQVECPLLRQCCAVQYNWYNVINCQWCKCGFVNRRGSQHVRMLIMNYLLLKLHKYWTKLNQSEQCALRTVNKCIVRHNTKRNKNAEVK